jgi:small-conductance mechanosensitive channel
MYNKGILDTINTLIIETEVKLISSLIVILLLWLLRSIVNRVLFQRFQDGRTRSLSRQIVGYVAFTLGLVLIGRLWLEGFQSLLIVLSLVFAAMIVSLKELLLNIASWSIIAWRQLFRIGDHIKIGDHYGEVVEMNMIYITLVELDEKLPVDPSGHRVVKIPNSLVLTQPIVNDSEGSYELWYELTVALSLESDWQKAQDILLEILKARTSAENAAEPTPDSQTSVLIRAGKIILIGRYLCDSNRQHEIEQDIWRDILTAMQHHERIFLV